MKKIVYLTNCRNSAPDEDTYLSKRLKEKCDVVVQNPWDGLFLSPDIGAVVIRNIWPAYEHLDVWKEYESMLKVSGLPVYNPLAGKGDMQGKDYLVELYQKNFPVIPSVNSVNDIGKLPNSERYWIKPKQGADGYGSRKLSKQKLMHGELSNYIIQPYIDFISEPSFFFIDNKFAYAVTTPNRLDDENIELFSPPQNEIELARSFVDWNGLPYGIQRIDFVRTNNKLLLTEIEDFCPYLYLLDLPAEARDEVTETLIQSMYSM